MSLHLIESRQVPVAARIRHPGGAAASIIAHAVLVTAALAVATGRVISRSPPAPVTELTYVEPPRPIEPAPDGGIRAAAPRTSDFAPVLPNIVMPDLQVPEFVSKSLPTIVDDFAGHQRNPTRGAGTSETGDRCSLDNCSGAAILDKEYVDKPVLLLPGSPIPRYPEFLRSAGVQDTVLLRFVVDTLGRVEPGSLAVDGTPHPAFVGSVRDALRQARFKPAEAGGRLVRQRVAQAYVFTLMR